ncbi:EamA family transporter [Paenibacillus sp. VCA1]|uniref:EamA family transporter n=1 Tax=Paenibacillus sp. VCA1 TaxID=3039148 RepID=UPI00287184B3|nr:EamA family transporter [Paenibacillus sp. VCA1]MDR9856042.1 EamA family transporter [Paenibacillus sp. VCA1]
MNVVISYLLLLCNIILLVFGQILFKLGLQNSGGLHWEKLIASVHIWCGLGLYGLATLLWFAVLSRLPLSIAYPLQSLAYILALVPAYFLFHETISMTKIAGVAVILLGAYLIVK